MLTLCLDKARGVVYNLEDHTFYRKLWPNAHAYTTRWKHGYHGILAFLIKEGDLMGTHIHPPYLYYKKKAESIVFCIHHQLCAGSADLVLIQTVVLVPFEFQIALVSEISACQPLVITLLLD